MKKKKNAREHAKNPLLSCSPVLTRREVSLSLSLSLGSDLYLKEKEKDKH